LFRRRTDNIFSKIIAQHQIDADISSRITALTTRSAFMNNATTEKSRFVEPARAIASTA
jgi:hypothetical protein